MNAASHLRSIDEAIQELFQFQSRTAAPGRISHQYIGTTIDNTIGLLAAPANSLDRGNRFILFESASNWLSLMQAVHRSFFSSLLSATELGLEHLAATHHLPVRSRQGEKWLAEVLKIQEAVRETCPPMPQLDSLVKHFSTYRPVFNDYLDAVLDYSSLDRQRKKMWRKFFKALSIVRNKVSHSDPSISVNERATLADGGLEQMIAKDGTLVANPRMYAQVATFVLDFFDILYAALPVAPSSCLPAEAN